MFSRADIWALATLVSADKAITGDRPEGVTFPMTYIGRHDCQGADATGVGGPPVDMPSPDLTTHGLLKFFSDTFGFDADETVTIMGAHAVAEARRENVGFGNLNRVDGWVFNPDSYELDNRYYKMFDISWEVELLENTVMHVPHRYQWYIDPREKGPIMTNSDIALVRDFSKYISTDKNGVDGFVTCLFDHTAHFHFDEEGNFTPDDDSNSDKPVCPIASKTMLKVIEHKINNEMFLYDFQEVLDKMVRNGYPMR